MRNPLVRFWELLKSPKYSRTLSILTLLIVAAAVPLTVYIAQQQQEIRQRAQTTATPIVQSTDAEELKSLIEDATTANGYGYSVTDLPNHNGLETAKIIESSPLNYIAVYHGCEKKGDKCKSPLILDIMIAQSTDLANWFFVKTLDTNAAQPAIQKLSNGAYLVAYEKWDPSGQEAWVRVLYYPDLSSLFAGNFAYKFDAPTTFSNYQGTPNIYSVTLSPDILHSSIQLGFHYLDKAKGGDRNARATLTNFSSWTETADTQMNSLLEQLGATYIGDRDFFSFRGKSYLIIEAATGPYNELNWKTYLFDYSNNSLTPLNIKTKNGSNSFSNPTVSVINLTRGTPRIVATYFIQDNPHGEAGELVFYKNIPSHASGRITDCTTGAGIPGVNVLIFNNRNNPISTTHSDGSWANYEMSLNDKYGVWPQCVSGLPQMPYGSPIGYICNNSVGPRALSSPHKSWAGIAGSLPNIGDYYDQAIDGIPSGGYNSYNFCYSSSSTPQATGTPTPTLPSTPTPTSTIKPTATSTPTPILNDLALNKPVVFNGQWSGYEGYKAVDGNPQTTWLQISKTGWLYVDLGSKKTISKIYINTGFEAKFYVQVSDDTVNWKLVWDHNWDNIGWRTQQTIDLSNSNISARYVLFANVDNKVDPYTHLYDFNVYGF